MGSQHGNEGEASPTSCQSLAVVACRCSGFGLQSVQCRSATPGRDPVSEAGKCRAPSSQDAGFVFALEPMCDTEQIASAPCISLPFSANRLWLVPSGFVHLYYRAQG